MTTLPPGLRQAPRWRRRLASLVQDIGRVRHYGIEASGVRLAKWAADHGRSLFPRRLTTLSDAEFFARGRASGSSWEAFADQERPSALPAFNRPDELRALLLSEHPDACQASVTDAERIVNGSLMVLGHQFMENGRIQWDLDPWSGTRFPARHRRRLGLDSFAADDRHTVDFMFANEVHKHTALLTLGKAFFVTRDERYAACAVSHLCDWVDRNPIEIGIAYYSTLTVAQRLMSWVFLWALLRESRSFRKQGLQPFVTSLCLQAEFLSRNLSAHWIPRNNFYLCELAALAFVGASLPELQRAGEWLAGSTAALSGELPRQVWPDGVSVEQSSGYQRLVLDLVLLVLLLRECPRAVGLDRVRQVGEALAEAHMHLLEPGGTLADIGDVSTERAVVLDDGREFRDGRTVLATAAALFRRPDMKWVAGRFAEESAWLLGPDGARRFAELAAAPPQAASWAGTAGGYYVMRSRWGPDAHQMVVDAGWTGMKPGGPGGHGHNDTLSFTLAIHGRPVIVDPGTYIYRGSPAWRDWFRSTRAHNTLTVDGEEMGVLGPGLFQVSQQPEPRVVEWHSAPCEDWLVAEHDGYRRLADSVIHRRAIRYSKPDAWVLEDSCRGEGTHRYEVRFHCAQDVTVTLAGAAVLLAPPGAPSLGMLFVGSSDLSTQVEEGWVSRQYGRKVSAPVVVGLWSGRLPTSLITVLVVLDDREADPWQERARRIAAMSYGTVQLSGREGK